MKPDVLLQIIKMNEKRIVMLENNLKNSQNTPKIILENNNEHKELSIPETVNLLKSQQNKIMELISLLQGKDREIYIKKFT